MYKCDTCNKDFIHKRNIKRHKRRVHNSSISTDINHIVKTKEPKHICLVCHRKFVERSSLRRHERSKHKMNISASLKSKKTLKCVTFEPSNLEDYPFLKKLVPEDYVYKVNQMEKLEKNHFRSTFEIADCAENVFFVWLSELEQKSNVTYRVKSFTKSLSPKILFNKVFRCIRNTFPNKRSIPNSKHTGCPATLTVRIKKCSEALSVKNTMVDNNVILIPLKAIVKLYHCHNHISLETSKECSSGNKEQKKINRTQSDASLINCRITENNLNKVHCNESDSSDTTFSSSQVSIKNSKYDASTTDMFEETIVHNKYVMDDDGQKMPITDENFELSDEFDKYIIVESISTENSFSNDNGSELHQLTDYDTVDETVIIKS